ncbi:MAG: arginine--tRNA ligase [Desulfosudaceae bacterium]
MKNVLRELIREAAREGYRQGELTSDEFPEIEVEEPRIREHGDFATNFAMVSASIQKMPPRRIAEIIIAGLADRDDRIAEMAMAGPGFINFFIKPRAWHPVLLEIDGHDDYGSCDLGEGQSIQVEFVSANPTGPLHVGHGRGAAVGDSLANILAFCGWQVAREYYINDAGNQISTLGRSVYLRWQEQNGHAVEYPDDCYQGDYIRALAEQIAREPDLDLSRADPAEAVSACSEFAAKRIMDGIRDDLKSFGISFDNWFSEKSLFESEAVAGALRTIRDKNFAYEAEGALWFKSAELGDEKDRVVVRGNGETTYFASDMAYHKNKLDRGFNRLVDVWGADHHGYVARIKAAVQALTGSHDALEVILVQLVNLLREGRPISMSTRAGSFVTLREVVDEVGVDAARFIFLSRHYDSPLDFDLELAKKKNNDNPVYYVQYVHARISSIIGKAAENDMAMPAAAETDLSLLDQSEEIELIKALSRYPEVVRTAALWMEPHRVTFYLLDLAAAFHSYYNRHKVLTDQAALTMARLALVGAVKKIIKSGLALLGVSAPVSM